MEDADRTAASGEDAATVDGVHFKAVTGIGRVSDKRAAGPPGEFKGEGIGVCRCPFSDDVGYEASVVLSGGIEGAADGSAQVDSMHPDVAGKADVVQVTERLPQSSVESEEWQCPDWCRHPASETQCLRCHPAPPGQKVPRVLGGFAPGGQPHSFRQLGRYRRFLP